MADYCTTAELKARLRITDSADDAEVALAVTSASRWVDGYCRRHFGALAETRTYAAASSSRVDTGDLVSVTSLSTDGDGDGVYETAWAAADYRLLPTDAPLGSEARPYSAVSAIASLAFPAGQDRVQVAGTFGWPAVPVPVKQATLIQAAELFKLKDTPFGVAGFGEFGVVRIRITPHVAALLAPYRIHPVLVA